jgi:hypothetical protein
MGGVTVQGDVLCFWLNICSAFEQISGCACLQLQLSSLLTSGVPFALECRSAQSLCRCGICVAHDHELAAVKVSQLLPTPSNMQPPFACDGSVVID